MTPKVVYAIFLCVPLALISETHGECRHYAITITTALARECALLASIAALFTFDINLQL